MLLETEFPVSDIDHRTGYQRPSAN